jgi:hypothetical protein
MKHGHECISSDFPADQDSTESIEPTMTSLHYPTTSLESQSSLDGLGLFSTCANMRRKSKRTSQISNFIVIVPFVQAESLRILFRRLRAICLQFFQCLRGKLHVMAIRAINHDAERNTIAINKQTSLGAIFAAIRRIWAGLFPPRAALLSSPHPLIATTSQCLPVRHTEEVLYARIPRRHPPPSIREIADRQTNNCKCSSSPRHSIGIPYVTQTESRSSHPCLARADCGNPKGATSWAAAVAPSSSKVSREAANHHHQQPVPCSLLRKQG